MNWRKLVVLAGAGILFGGPVVFAALIGATYGPWWALAVIGLWLGIGAAVWVENEIEPRQPRRDRNLVAG